MLILLLKLTAFCQALY